MGTLGAGCGGGGTATETSGTEELATAISRYTGLSATDADAVASSVRTTSPEALAALTRTVDDAPALPSSAAVATDLETIGRDKGFDGAAALADLCKAILAGPIPKPSIQLDPAGDRLEVRWLDADPALQLGRVVHRASVSILNRKFNGPNYEAIFLEQFEDTIVEEAANGVPESDPNKVLLWLRFHQLRSGACA